jgi:hypothetical protein
MAFQNGQKLSKAVFVSLNGILPAAGSAVEPFLHHPISRAILRGAGVEDIPQETWPAGIMIVAFPGFGHITPGVGVAIT